MVLVQRRWAGSWSPCQSRSSPEHPAHHTVTISYTQQNYLLKASARSTNTWGGINTTHNNLLKASTQHKTTCSRRQHNYLVKVSTHKRQHNYLVKVSTHNRNNYLVKVSTHKRQHNYLVKVSAHSRNNYLVGMSAHNRQHNYLVEVTARDTQHN